MTGLKTIPSGFSVKETIDRLASIVQSKGLTVFARIDHSANAAEQGLELRPTELIIFGNPKVGTALMQDQPTCGIDLPVKALAWQDASERVWLTYNETSWLKERHGLSGNSEPVLKAIEEGMDRVCMVAANERTQT